MNTSALAFFLLSLVGFIGLCLKDRTITIFAAAITMVVTSIPVLTGIFDLFSSPKSIKLRIWYSILHYASPDWHRANEFKKKSVGKEAIYCNPFYTDSQSCKHNFVVGMCDWFHQDKITFESQTWSKEMISMNCFSQEDKEYLISLYEIISPNTNLDSLDDEFGIGYLEKFELRAIVHSLPVGFQFNVVVRINFPNLSLILTYKSKGTCDVSLNYSDVGFQGIKSKECIFDNFTQIVDIYLFIKLRERTCCFINKDAIKVRHGMRLHCEEFFSTFVRFCKGDGIVYKDCGSGVKWVEGIDDTSFLKKVLEFKWGGIFGQSSSSQDVH